MSQVFRDSKPAWMIHPPKTWDEDGIGRFLTGGTYRDRSSTNEGLSHLRYYLNKCQSGRVAEVTANLSIPYRLRENIVVVIIFTIQQEIYDKLQELHGDADTVYRQSPFRGRAKTKTPTRLAMILRVLNLRVGVTSSGWPSAWETFAICKPSTPLYRAISFFQRL